MNERILYSENINQEDSFVHSFKKNLILISQESPWGAMEGLEMNTFLYFKHYNLSIRAVKVDETL